MDRKKVLILQTSGVETPKRTYAPLFFAVTAAAMDMEVKMYFTMEGPSQLKKGEAEKVELVKGSGVTLKTWLDRALENRVRLLACLQAMEVYGYGREDLMEGVEIVGAASLFDLIDESDTVMYF